MDLYDLVLFIFQSDLISSIFYLNNIETAHVVAFVFT